MTKHSKIKLVIYKYARKSFVVDGPFIENMAFQKGGIKTFPHKFFVGYYP